MSAYITRARIESVIPAPFLVEALDDDRDGAEDDGKFDEVVAAACNAVNGYLAGRYNVPFPLPFPTIVVEASFIFTCELIYDRREAGDKNPYRKRADEFRSDLRVIAKGEAPLDATQKPAFSPGVSLTEENVLNATFR